MSRATVFDPAQHVRKPLDRLARMAGIAIIVAAVGSAIEGALLLTRAAAMSDAVAEAEKYRLATTGTLPISVTSFCVAAASLIALFAWLAWQYRAQANLVADGHRVRYAPAWSVLWWFVPVADLWMPAVTMSDLWRGSAVREGRGASAWRVWLWWWPFVIGFLVRIAGHGIRAAGMVAAEMPTAFPGEPGLSADDVATFVRVGSVTAGIGDVVLLAVAPLALLVLSGVTRRHSADARVHQTATLPPARPDR